MPLPADAITAITAHMNGDHAEDNVLICRALGGQPLTVAASMTGLDDEAIEFSARLDDGSETVVRVPWSEPLRDRAQVRIEVVRMYQEACEQLGVAARSHGE